MIKKYLLPSTALILFLFWPIQAQELGSASEPKITSPERLNTISETTYLDQLSRRGINLESQGFLIESLDGSMVFADHHSDIAFNPASVIKVATSFAALNRLGPDYHFDTAFYMAGVINKKTQTLNGDLVLHSTGDPFLSTADVNGLVRQLIRAGIKRVTGDLVVTGPFTFGTNWTTPAALKKLQGTFRNFGLRVLGTTKPGAVKGVRLAGLTSPSLREILFFQNAHSSNPTAERIGEAIGGPGVVEEFLVRTVGVAPGDVHVGRTSGLDYNRITPRGTVLLLRRLVEWLQARNLEPDDLMPMAGVDVGTLQRRFSSETYRGAVVGKTGTLPGTDGGVSTLAGIAYTRNRGPVLFAIFNTKGSVNTYRRLQDTLVEDLIVEFGGAAPLSASSRRSSN